MQKKGFNTALITLPLLYFMLTCILTSPQYRNFFDVTFATICGAIVYLVFLFYSNNLNMPKGHSVLLLLGVQILIIGIYTFFISHKFYLEETKGYIKGLIFLCATWLVSIILKEIEPKKRKTFVLIYLFAIVLFSALTLYVELTGPENIIRYTAMGIFLDANVIFGGYDFIYSLVIVYTALFFYYVLNRKKISIGNRIFIIISLVIMFLTILFSNFSTAILLTVLFSFAPFIAKAKHKFIVTFFILFAFMVLSRSIAEIIKSLPLNSLTTIRISNLILSLVGEENIVNPISGDGQRLDRILWTLNVIAEKPIFGGIVDSFQEVFGNHTEWLDKTARYGLFYMVLHASFWMTARKKIIAFCETTEEKNLIKTAFLVFIILGFTNPIALVTTPAPLFLLCPHLNTVFTAEDNKIKL